MKTLALSALALMTFAGAANASIANLGDGLVTSAAGLTRIGGMPSDRYVTPGDTFSAALLGQTTVAPAAGFMTLAGRTSTFTFGNNNLHGTLVGNSATVNIQSIDLGDIAPGVRRIVVACFTNNTTNLWVNGINIGGNPVTQGRFDVGSVALGGNGLAWNNLPGAATSVSIFSALWSPSNAFAAPIATSAALTNSGTLTNFGSLVVWNGVVGFTGIINEVDIIFDITYIPTTGTASLLAMGGLIATRRRRA
ncbi:MAG: hypothetical protein JNK16_03495 [Phycisphaerales bacterium]|nr:hypothetical protein [Phycisphaerales bacterium]